ncbi:MAG TPA: GNAT family N-acetyltransferase [Cyclobacteriaceae bacterium]|jgi:GNAT superfamily N-acetyltransferase|nr:GNAT family N-acetyltransferase [Cyclobacteriaceae bacterium]HMV10540.1 GNAT family N-acetyltransferase [Cyclobacteriaceae bacterium]HMV89606.1 GNAT family N-acetyltransferase [Cyclobacteriaceae bacterium]HMW99448.1 GNAT family N-acetyltransferase [Cyclobacteriaceae bacterium]HMX48763.1 GNAT family N-acetyltransferase [Cyclobacteriaceae bacterium]
MIEQAELSLETPSISSLSESDRYIAVEVQRPGDERAFLQVPEGIYRLDPFWIPPVHSDISSIFNSAQNPYFSHGEAARWIVVNQTGKPCGRIAAFINFNKQFDDDKKIGGIGFFECIEDDAAANTLFSIAIAWLKERHHVDVIDGPINFGENDKYWGLLVKGTGPVSYGMNYNPAFYLRFFHSFGFSILYKQLTTYVSLARPLPERFVKIAARVAKSRRYKFESIKYRDRGRFIRDFVQVNNSAWATFKGFHPMEESVIEKSLREMRPIMVEELIWFAYADNTPIGFLVAIPDVNRIIKYAGPELDLWGKCKFLFYKWVKGFTTVRVVVMGIVPEYRNQGIESAMIVHAFNEARKRSKFKHVQLSWVGDFNDKMIALHKAMNGIEFTQHATFRKVL